MCVYVCVGVSFWLSIVKGFSDLQFFKDLMTMEGDKSHKNRKDIYDPGWI